MFDAVIDKEQVNEQNSHFVTYCDLIIEGDWIPVYIYTPSMLSGLWHFVHRLVLVQQLS